MTPEGIHGHGDYARMGTGYLRTGLMAFILKENSCLVPAFTWP